ncbi:dermonecrotic toxin domain-containing protein [Pseudomonas sp. P8_241]|uniref:dermonecrotic toxin domain-containing protein n=1 Tax=Pseudomonas sp. P8_241 TaxID=3043445 RepID=UPI002A35DEC1|nr:DUF6543 domain-containing protein [Pseudomonas sp. P8_241]WPN49920.1 hypothetical protein QMK58_14435 [Pseudomonas sp. P8_241]
MTDSFIPYFFDEAERASKAKQPGDREKALGFTTDDLNWLQAVYLPTDATRKANVKPMSVHQLLLDLPDSIKTPLAGAFAMSRPVEGDVVLYTPWKGLVKYADMDDLKTDLKTCLTQDTGKLELLRYLSVQRRHVVLAGDTPDISVEVVEGAVFEHQQTTLELNRTQNVEAMMAELRKTPTLQSMLDETLNIAFFSSFPKLDQRRTRLECTRPAVGTIETPSPTTSLSLSEALLQRYASSPWPADETRTFSNPKHGVSNNADNQTWESTLTDIAGGFTPRLQSQIETFWNTELRKGVSREAFFTECLRDAFHLNLLLKRQEGVLTTEEYLRLVKVSLASVADNPLRIEKVRISAPFKHYVDLASTLMIGESGTPGFLYTQTRGIEATTDLPALQKIVLLMLKSEGHEDNLLNYMSLDERRTFLDLESDKRTVTGVPIPRPVFEHLMADILAKQQENLTCALRAFLESEGKHDLHGLVGKALDVRGYIDDRLLAIDGDERWNAQAVHQWAAQPATVRAETAKAHLALLNTLTQALEHNLQSHPAIPAATLTVADAKKTVDASVKKLQSDFAHLLGLGLKSELELRMVDRTLSATEQAMIKAVLDNPVRLQRAALNNNIPDICSLALKANGSDTLLKLSSCFVLTERRDTDPTKSGKAILWTPALGYEPFPSLPALKTELDQRLLEHDKRTFLLENLSRSERSPTRSYTLAPLQQVNENFLDQVQRPFVQLDETSVTEALATTASTATRARLLHQIALRQPQTGLRRATDIAKALTTRQSLPAWLANASIEDQVLHAELLQQYLDCVKDDQDCLSDIPSLARTAHQELQKLLKADTFDLDPDKIELKFTAPQVSTQILTAFALSHFDDLDAARFTVASLDTTPIPGKVDATYVKDLIRKLNLGQRHQEVLKQYFAPTHTDAPARRKRFVSQVPWQLMHYAHTQKLRERLSGSGFDLIKQIMDMPDATARATVNDANAIIRPLEFAGIKKDQTIQIPGVYLIGTHGNDSGRQVLVAPYSPRHGLKEYEDQHALMSELKAPGMLRHWVLGRLPDSDRTLCKERFSLDSQEAAVSLASNPLKGNVLVQLFKDNAVLLGQLLGCQADTEAQSEWATVKHVLGEDLREMFSFCMGKLAYPITVWRSFRQIQASAEHLQNHHWTAAVSGLVSGLAQLASLRGSMVTKNAPSAAVSTLPTETPDTPFNWKDIAVTALERTQLKQHEASDVELHSMALDTALGLYKHAATQKTYGAVEGKVYPVEKKRTRWRIVGNKKPGPYLRQSVTRQWIIDPPPALPMAPSQGVLKRVETVMAVWEGMNVDANGMPQIRVRFPVKAREIEEGLNQATTYVWNAFRNLQLLKETGDAVTPVHQLIMDFADVPKVEPIHVTMVEKVIAEIFTALLDPTLRAPNSKRFAVGRVLADPENTFGFIVPSDPKRKIYLAEQFFRPVFDYYRNYMSDAAFPIRAHTRAATLIHELSHIVCNTEDIAYLDSGRPFHTLIETTSVRARALKDALSNLHKKGLSSQTPLPELFSRYNDDLQVWEDLGQTYYEETDRPLLQVLRLTGDKTLSDARVRFKRDPLVRLAVQLGNADSVTLLITQMGRQLHVSTP